MEENMAGMSLLQHPPEATVTLKMKAVRSAETSEHFITTRYKNPNNIRENLKTYNWLRVKRVP
jgi:hypothetical protein